MLHDEPFMETARRLFDATKAPSAGYAYSFNGSFDPGFLDVFLPKPVHTLTWRFKRRVIARRWRFCKQRKPLTIGNVTMGPMSISIDGGVTRCSVEFKGKA